ncbi:MAG: tRNA preQ1(34) S-adenosylmethionine ribosyltransferase-isomerase QueA [Longimicrobiales bacterium]|nr:tRNA preQ1(34) S-adenosylmethionine ribosyltransferase-isomerase QueA [Longimicrobiales bacterium]
MTPTRTPDGARTADYDYALPPGRIATHPADRRDASRLLVVDRSAGAFLDRRFPDLVEWFEPGDLLVVNESRVLPARLRGHRATGGRVELLLLAPATDGHGLTGEIWTALIRPGRKLRAGDRVTIPRPGSPPVPHPAREDGARAARAGGAGREVTAAAALEVTVVDDPHERGVRRVRFAPGCDALAALSTFGELPLPPYLERDAEPADRERYQTVYARVPGSVAAPTAGLHFTDAVLRTLADRGVERAAVTLHVGAGTFRPVEVADPADHVMHAEVYEVPASTAEAVARCRERGGAVWAVGTTVVRTLESVAVEGGGVRAGSGSTRLFLHPPARPAVVDGLLTNFHLPRSTLMMLVATVIGYERTMRAYAAAVDRGYRFYSYGDAMLIPPNRSAR